MDDIWCHLAQAAAALKNVSFFSSHLYGHPEAKSFEEGAAGPMTSDGFGVLACVCL